MPGGKTADWLGAATYDKHVGLSLFTGQITHKIDANVDHERDFVIDCLKKERLLKQLKLFLILQVVIMLVTVVAIVSIRMVPCPSSQLRMKNLVE